MRLGAIKERRSRPTRETWKESGLHIESGQITVETHPGAYGKKIKVDLITYQTRYGYILREISK